MSAHSFLRQATREAHDRVDAAFARFDLRDRTSYTRFLRAHGRALAAAEASLATRADLPSWTPRTPLLAGDLDELGEEMPAPLPFAPPATRAGMLGLLYVVEGSRLGGVMLARAVAPGLPSRYLSARHAPGAWRTLLAGIDAEAGDDRWRRDALAGALAGFALFGAAVDGAG